MIINNAILAAKLSKRVGNSLSIHGISLTEYMVLDFLANNSKPEVARIELAEYIALSASGITRLLLPMEKNHLVEKVKNPRDSRQSLVKLSATGQTLYQDAKQTFRFASESILKDITEKQQEKWLEISAKVNV